MISQKEDKCQEQIKKENRGGWLGSLEETHTDTRFNSLFSRTTWVRWQQKG